MEEADCRVLAYCLLATCVRCFRVFLARPCQEMEGFARLALKYNLFVVSDEVRVWTRFWTRFCAAEG